MIDLHYVKRDTYLDSATTETRKILATKRRTGYREICNDIRERERCREVE